MSQIYLTPKERAVLKRKKPSLSQALPEELARVLSLIRESAHYDMISAVKIAQFYPHRRTGVDHLEEASIADLVKLSAVGICTLKAVGARRIKQLTDILARFTAQDAAQSPAESPPDLVKTDRAEEHLRVLGSVEAEEKLAEAFARLCNYERLHEVADKKLASFWRSDWPNDPFIVCLTVRQLSQMKPRLLLEKRSFTPKKVAAVIACIEVVLQQDSSEGIGGREHGSEVLTFPRKSLRSIPLLKAEHKERRLPLHVRRFLLELERACRAAAGEENELSRLLAALPDALPQYDLGLLWLVSEHDTTLAAQLLGIEEQVLSARHATAREALLCCARENSSTIYRHWEILLGGPGITAAALADSYGGASLDKEVVERMCSLLADAMGAEPVQLGGGRILDLLTFTPAFAATVERLLLASLPREDHELRADLAALFPGVDSDLLCEAFSGVAHFSASTGRWDKV